MIPQIDPQATHLQIARTVMESEADAVRDAAARLGTELGRAVEVIINHPGKVVITGVGKSGHIGHKIAATLCSTGTPAVFLHPTEATHGDLGIYTPGDPTIILSRSGSTQELMRLVPLLRQFNSPLIGILGKRDSWLAHNMDVVLDAWVAREADPHNLAPTTSATVALVLGDALAVALMQARNFAPADYARFHPGGQLGRNLHLQVGDVMHSGSSVPWIATGMSLKEVVISMTERPLGAAPVVDDHFHLRGLVTDGDLRRALLANDDIRSLHASDVMTTNPVTVSASASLKEALQLMEDRPRQISVLPVVSEDQVCVGVIRVHDIYLSGAAHINGSDGLQTDR
ncbi:MAG: KpsF/GutQ family sugar-phosphate isomerase [Anaerolineae bacterium]|nr:KpsF/GutQ family sugar-phosphate isomerase [Anaerolineae bacterium]